MPVLHLTQTPLYAGLLALIYLALSLRVIARRRAMMVALGDGADEVLRRRIRVHANFGEYAFPVLLLMLVAELQGAPALLLHGLGLALIIGRCSHAYGVAQTPEPLIFRMIGMSLTFAALGIGAVTILVLAVAA